MIILRQAALWVFVLATQQALASRCGNTHTLISNLTIDVNNRNTDVSTLGSNSNTVIITHSVVVPTGITLTITGLPPSAGSRLKVLFKPATQIVVEPGGILIIEYTDLKEQGNCSFPDNTNTTWDGILVKGNPNYDHYSYYDFTNGWDPYAAVFQPDGVYKTSASGDFAHGRLQMRWCTVQDIYQQAAPGPIGGDESSTTYVNEGAYGNYAIRSTEGGILNIISSAFSNVKTAILIDNYERYATKDPASKLMNAFQIIDCDFDVSTSQITTVGKYKCCIELFEAQKVTIEGCHFSCSGTATDNVARGRALLIERSSMLLRKSGNFRRSTDLSIEEGSEDCPLYGNEQGDLENYPPDHPWLVGPSRKCAFSSFYRAIEFEGTSRLVPLHTLAIDDAEFTDNFYSIGLHGAVSPTISRCSFSFTEDPSLFTFISNGGDDHFLGSDQVVYRFLNAFDRLDIVSYEGQNTLITACDFASDYDGDPSNFKEGRTIYIALSEQFRGKYDHTRNKYVYDLVYKCDFTESAIQNHDIGVWIAKDGNDGNNFSLVNCCDFDGLRYGIAIGRDNTQLEPQFHYTDRKTGQNAACRNTFSSNSCNFKFPGAYSQDPVAYYFSTNDPSSGCSSSHLDPITTTEVPGCDPIDCTEYIMTSIDEDPQKRLQIMGGVLDVHPNPSQSDLSVTFTRSEGLSQSAELHIFDYLGKQVCMKTYTEDESEVSVSLALKAGLYFATVVDKEGNVSNATFTVID